MGADLLLAHWWTTKGVDDIDWGACRDAVGTLTEETLDTDQWSDVGFAMDDVRKTLLDDLDYMEPIWKGNAYARDTDTYVFGPVTVLQSGGMSWGDDPTEGWTIMVRMPVDVLKAGGFFS